MNTGTAAVLGPRSEGGDPPLDGSDAWAGLPLLIPIPAAATLLGISRSTAYRCAHSGELPVTRFGGRVYANTARLRTMLEAS